MNILIAVADQLTPFVFGCRGGQDIASNWDLDDERWMGVLAVHLRRPAGRHRDRSPTLSPWRSGSGGG
ncbi:MAG: hypothetical protein RIM84_13770 [Alphaproteobacteria bacterium]